MNNEYLDQLVKETDVNSKGGNNVVRPFWLKESENTTCKRSTQAALTALYKSGYISCKGEPGAMTFYRIKKDTPLLWFFKVDGPLKVGLSVYALIFISSLLLNQASGLGDFGAFISAAFLLLFSWMRASQSWNFGPLMAYVPGVGTTYSRMKNNIAVGFYTIGVIYAIGLLATVLWRFFSGVPRVSSGGLEIVYQFPIQIVNELVINAFSGGIIDLIVGYLIAGAGVAIIFMAAWFVGSCFYTGFERSTLLLRQHGLLEMYNSEGLQIDRLTRNPYMGLFGLIIPVYFTIATLMKLW
tara:strand:+ start:4069 stop:4959 length:891 start_codon:yes stop_codon:yes gene_type:complete